MICVRCNKPFDPDDSLIGDQGVCEECWQIEVADSYAEYLPFFLALAEEGAE